MLKATTGFTLPDDVRVEASALVDDDFTDREIVGRLIEKGVLIPYVEEEPPADEDEEGAEELPAPVPSPPTTKRSKRAQAPADGEGE